MRREVRRLTGSGQTASTRKNMGHTHSKERQRKKWGPTEVSHKAVRVFL